MQDPLPPSATGPAGIEIDARIIARGLGLEVAHFRQLMDQRKISVLCERGTGDDAGLYRATFYHRDRRLRLMVDAAGQPVETPLPPR